MCWINSATRIACSFPNFHTECISYAFPHERAHKLRKWIVLGAIVCIACLTRISNGVKLDFL